MSSLQFWFFPVRSGDIRLEAAGDDACTMTVEDPTPADKKRLLPFLQTARELGWIDEIVGVQLTGVTRIEIGAGIAEVGPLLADDIHKDASLWTAVRFSDGSVTISDGPQLPAAPQADQGSGEDLVICGGEPADNGEPTEDKQLPAKTEPTAAATFRPPRQGCPAPTACERRASEVLRAFCTERQWRQWQRQGRMRVTGNATGKRYDVYHRNEASRQRLSHGLVEVRTGRAICVWDDSVPPEEEALAMKLAIEHREAWMLQLPRGAAASTRYGRRRRR